MSHTRRLLLLMLIVLCSLGVEARTKKKQPPAETEQAVTKSANPATPASAFQKPAKKTPGAADEEAGSVMRTRAPMDLGPATEQTMVKAPGGPHLDLRALPFIPPVKFERPEHEEPALNPGQLGGIQAVSPDSIIRAQEFPKVATAIAPAPIMNFSGLDFANWGAGHPPDTNGDVGPTYYIQTINTSIGIFRKSDGVRVAAFTFNTFMSQGHFGNLCDTNNFGDPVVLYDTFEDRWIITDFAFQLDGSSNVINPPGNFQCFAVSMTGDPVSGGWNYYSINTTGGLGDYPKFGVWPDGIYMSTNMFNYPSGGAFQNSRLYAFNKAQMYAGAASIQVVSFNLPSSQFTVLPANARLQTGTPPAGRPNYFASVWNFLNAIEIWKFHVDWNHTALSAVTGPFDSTMAFWWEQYNRDGAGATTATTPKNFLDTLYPRLLVQNQYSNIGGVESLWDSHSVGAGNPTTNVTSTQAAVRYYQVNVTGDTVAANTVQSFTYSPDATVFRYMPSTAVNRNGDMAIGYTTSNGTINPTISYAGRAAADPVNSITATEQTLIAGTGSQTGTCGPTCTRWGDYSAMTLDPDGCTFWYTNEYYATNDLNHVTRIGSFALPCTPVGAGGTLSGTVTAAVGGAPIVGATVLLGSRSTTTNGTGGYTFTGIPAGTYATVTASYPGYVTGTATNVVITDGNTTIQNLSLATAATSGCTTDTTQSDFQAEVATNLDLTTSAGDALLSKPDLLDQSNATVSPTGFAITNTSWAGQTFTPALSGQLTRADVELFCSGCSGANPNITVSIRATTGATPVPTGADLASTTLAGFNDGGAGGLKTVTFSTPLTVTAGTRYALIFRAVAARTGSYAYTCSCATTGFVNSSPYASGQRVTSANSGATWTADTTTGGRDLNFAIYVNQGYATSGSLVSSNRDANAAAGFTPVWTNLSWNGVTPANTSLKFQVAGSNSFSGPFNFVGPDGTAATFFTTSPASLGQFYSFRYLQYKALLGTTNTTVTPTLNDATVCFTDLDCSAPAAITPAAPLVCVSSTGNTASGPAGATSYAWSITNGTITGGGSSQTVTFTAGAAGSVGLNLTIVTVDGCHHVGSASLPIGVATPTVTPGGPTTFCAGGSVTLTSSSATGNQWYLNSNPIGGATSQSYIATASGNYTVVVTQSACNSPASSITTVTVNPLPATPTITPGGPTTFCAGGNVTLSSSAASGNQWYLNGNPIGGATNQTYVAAASGAYTVTTTDGNGCTSAASAGTTVTVNPLPAAPTITPGGPTTFCTGGSVTLTSNAASGNQWYLNGNPIGGATNQTYVAAASGAYTVTTTDGNGCTSAASAGTTVTVNPLPAAPIITPGGPTTFCAGGSVTLTSSAASGNQWYLNGNPIGGATNQNFVANASGNYTVTTTDGNGCTSSASAATTVTVNPIPATPTITPGGPTTFCAGGSVTLTSSAASGNQWYLNGNPIGGATNQSFIATLAGDYTVVVTALGCSSAASAVTTVIINPIPATPTITPGGPTTFCNGGSVTLTSSSASGNQWYLNGNPIGGATNQDYIATASGDYTVVVITAGCSSSPSAATTVTVNSAVTTPTVTPGGPTTFCAGGSVTLTSSSASGNQWYLNSNPIGGATNQNFIATASGDYTVVVTVSGCSSSPSAATTVTVNPIPATPAITPGGPTTFCLGGSVTLTSSSASGNQWYLNGNPIGGATAQTYLATASGNYTVIVTSLGCSSAASAVTTVTVNPIPATPTVTPGGPTTFCAGGSVMLTSSSASGNQWYLNGNPVGGATNQTYSATASGNYTVVVTSLGCSSAASAAATVTVNPIPATPTVTPGGPTTFCAGGSVLLTSSSASGNQWYLNGNPIGGATNQTYSATASGNYTTVVTSLGCSSAASAPATVTVNPIPATPTITPGGPTSFCPGGSVTLTSSSATGNQWYLNGNPIGGATSQQYVANASGDYSVTVTSGGCTSLASAATTVTVNPNPNASITAGSPMMSTATATASVAGAGAGATYAWSITNGTINSGNGTNSINFTAGSAGTLTLHVTVTTAAGCGDTQSANVTVTNFIPPVTVTSVSPNNGTWLGGTAITINGTGFLVGASVTVGGSPATSVVVFGPTKITAKTPAHTAGPVNVTVTNTNTSSGTLTSGYTYAHQFDANGDNVVDPSDLFYLIKYIFDHGPAPSGGAGMLSGDANNDGVVDAADIFYLVNYLFLSGPAPASLPGRSTNAVAGPFGGTLSFGAPVVRDGRTYLPILFTPADGAATPQAFALKIDFDRSVRGLAVHRAGAAKDATSSFEISRPSAGSISYLVAFNQQTGGLTLGPGAQILAEVEISGAVQFGARFDAALTAVTDGSGVRAASVSRGNLTLSSSAAGDVSHPSPKEHRND